MDEGKAREKRKETWPGGVERPFPVATRKDRENTKCNLKKKGVMMKRGFWTGMAAALMAGMAGCVKNDTSPGDSALPGAINFGVSTESRAVINTAADMREFSVWGHYVENGKAVDVFGESNTENTGETVSKNGDGAWGYEGGYRFWTEANYYFHALYPIPPDNVKHVIEYEDNNHISSLAIAEYDVMDGGTDLLYAEAKGITKETNGGMVALTFYHLLTRVEFVAKLDATAANYGVTATVTEAKLYGMCKDGTFSSAGFDESNAASITNGWISKTNPSTLLDTYARATKVSVTKDGVNVFGENKDIFVFPGSVGADYCFDVNYTVGGKAKEVNVNLVDLAEKTWEPGKVYRYTLTVTAEASLKLTVKVLDWEGESASVSW